MTTSQTTPELPGLTMREAFVNWAAKNGLTVEHFRGEYTSSDTQAAWEGWQGAKEEEDVRLTAAPQEGVSVPPGYAVVPLEPTREMLFQVQDNCDILPPRGKRVWAQFLAAAPPPLSPPDTGNVGAEAASSIDHAQRVGHFGTPEEWREACRMYRIRHNSGDCEMMSKMRTYVEEGLLEVTRPSALPPPGREMVPMSPEKRDEIYRQVQADVAQMEAEHRYTFAGWFPVAVRLIEAHHGIKEGSATPLGDGGGRGDGVLQRI